MSSPVSFFDYLCIMKMKIKLSKIKPRHSSNDAPMGAAYEYMHSAGMPKDLQRSSMVGMEEGCGCGCSSCNAGKHHGKADPFEEYGASDGPEDLNDDGELSACELKHHFDLNHDGMVTPDEYDAHVNWHCRHPEVLDNMMNDYESVKNKIYDEEDEYEYDPEHFEDEYDYEPEEYYDDKEGYYELEESKVLSLSKLLVEKKKKTKKDRCYRLAKQKYDVFPSAYASGFIVRCRKGKVAKKKK